MPAHAGGSSLGNLDFDNQDYDDLGEQLHDLDEQDPEPYDHQLGRGNFMNTASRYSLAFELASALEPSSNTTADLMAELGIEEDEHATQNDLSFVSEHEETLDGLPERDTSLISSSKSTPLRRTQLRESQAALRESRNMAMLPAPAEGDDSTAEAALASANESIQGSLAEIDMFIRLLNTLNGTEANTEAPLHALPMERQFAVEKLVSALTKALYELAKRREDQIKELKEMETAIGDPDPAWQMSLAEVEPLPVFREFSSAETQYNATLADVQEEDEDEDVDHQIAVAQEPRSSHPLASPRNPILPELLHLRNSTDLLITSLSSVADQTHVGKATNTGISRKLKSMQGALTGMKQEAESVERSIEYVKDWEEKEFGANSISALKVSALPTIAPRRRKTSASSSNLSSSSNSTTTARKISGSYSERVRGEMKAAFSLLETCHEQARFLLTMAS